METFLNITLLLIGSIATLSAFGGETWEKGDEPLLERITKRGWISIACLVLALGLGVWKEIYAEQKSIMAARSEARKDEEAKTLREQLAGATSEIQRQTNELIAIQRSQLTAEVEAEDAENTLQGVRTNLASAQDTLVRTSNASAISALVGSQIRVKEFLLFIPVEGAPQGELSIRHAMLPPLPPGPCAEFTGLDVWVQVQEGFQVDLIHSPYESKTRVGAYGGDLKFIETIASPEPKNDNYAQDKELLGDLTQWLGHSRPVSTFYFAALQTDNSNNEASSLYSALAEGTEPAVRIVANPADMKLVGDKAYYERFRAASSSRKKLSFPPECNLRIRNYFSHAFDRAALILLLDTAFDQAIYFPLKASATREERGEWIVDFRLAASPQMTGSRHYPDFDLDK